MDRTDRHAMIQKLPVPIDPALFGRSAFPVNPHCFGKRLWFLFDRSGKTAGMATKTALP